MASAESPPSADAPLITVAPEVTRRKLEAELALWRENAEAYRRRGWVILDREDLTVDVGFLAPLPIGGASLPVLAASVRFDFTNYDLWPPSVAFIDPITREFSPPLMQAIIQTDEGPRDLLVSRHPATGRPFFCVPGTREYHDHPQHSGDSWLLHRSGGEGTLATLCDRIWRTMARNLMGLQVALITLPPETGASVQVEIKLASGDMDAITQAAAAHGAPA